MPRQETEDNKDLKCPECRATLKSRRTRHPDKCEMLCGGCGQVFDVCHPETARLLREQSQ